MQASRDDSPFTEADRPEFNQFLSSMLGWILQLAPTFKVWQVAKVRRQEGGVGGDRWQVARVSRREGCVGGLGARLLGVC